MKEGLAITETSYASEMNQWPVIYISFKDCKGKRDNALRCIYAAFYTAIKPLRSEITLDEDDRFLLDRLWHILLTKGVSRYEELSDALKFLSRLLYQHYGKKVIMLIDEYDTPMINAYEG